MYPGYFEDYEMLPHGMTRTQLADKRRAEKEAARDKRKGKRPMVKALRFFGGLLCAALFISSIAFILIQGLGISFATILSILMWVGVVVTMIGAFFLLLILWFPDL